MLLDELWFFFLCSLFMVKFCCYIASNRRGRYSQKGRKLKKSQSIIQYIYIIII